MSRLFKSRTENLKKEDAHKEISFATFRETSEFSKKEPLPAARHYAISKFLQHVVYGEQKAVQAMLKKDPSLQSERGDVVDYYGRIFYNITGFKYAVWALDRHMWEMMLPFMNTEDIALQIKELEDHGLTYIKNQEVYEEKYDSSLSYLLSTMQEYTVQYNFSADAAKANTTLWAKVCDAQKQLPVHVVNEYLRKDRAFYPLPHFLETFLPRNIYFYNQPYLPSFLNVGGKWFSSLKGWRGEIYGFLRGNQEGKWVTVPTPKEIAFDLNALSHLYQTRHNEVLLVKKWLHSVNSERKLAEVPLQKPSAPIEDIIYAESDNPKECSLHLQNYLANFDYKKSFTEVIDELQLNESEEMLLSKFIDPWTHDYMNIPVILHGQAFDFETIRDLTTHPLTQEKFSVLEIQPAYDLKNEFEESLLQIQNMRLEQATLTNYQRPQVSF